MKKTAVVLLLLICTMFTLCACQREANMVEDMVSTVFSENDKNNSGMNNNGTVTDGDGIIGNENNGTLNRNDTNNYTDNVM